MSDLVYATIRTNMKGLRRYQADIHDAIASHKRNAVHDAIEQWAIRYRTFIQRRFVKFSRGGGNWPPLKSKRKRGKKGASAILRDTGTLFTALTPIFKGSPGALQEYIKGGIRVGFGGPSRHPGGRATVADIASFHQTGAGYLPVRKIIVEPPRRVVGQMVDDMVRALRKLGKIHNVD